MGPTVRAGMIHVLLALSCATLALAGGFPGKKSRVAAARGQLFYDERDLRRCFECGACFEHKNGHIQRVKDVYNANATETSPPQNGVKF